MGRPLKRPTIKPLKRADGTVRAYLVSATVGGKQLKEIVPTLDVARALAAKWQGSKDASFSFLPTTLTVQDLRASELWVQTCRTVGITPAEDRA
jgi:hypothetical protein